MDMDTSHHGFVTRNREDVNEHTTSTWSENTRTLLLARLTYASSEHCSVSMAPLGAITERVSCNPIYAPEHAGWRLLLRTHTGIGPRDM